MARRKDYDEFPATIRVPKGTTLDQSRKTPGALRATARDADGHLAGQAEILPTQSEPESNMPWVVDSPVEDTPEEAPDISQLVPIALVAAVGIAAGVAGAKLAQNRKQRRREAASIAAPTTTPPGWYAEASDPTRLR
jgi:hypothetical protein